MSEDGIYTVFEKPLYNKYLSRWSSKLRLPKRHTLSISKINQILQISIQPSTSSLNLSLPDILSLIWMRMEMKSLFRINRTIKFWCRQTTKQPKSTLRKLMSSLWRWPKKFKLRNTSVKSEKNFRAFSFKNQRKKLRLKKNQLFLKLIKVWLSRD